MSKGKGRGASIISGPESELWDSPFYCAACDKARFGRLAVRVGGSRLCWPCARAVYRRLAREVVKGTTLGAKLHRVGLVVPPPPPEADHGDLQLMEGRARAELERDRTDLLRAALPVVAEEVLARRRRR